MKSLLTGRDQCVGHPMRDLKAERQSIVQVVLLMDSRETHQGPRVKISQKDMTEVSYGAGRYSSVQNMGEPVIDPCTKEYASVHLDMLILNKDRKCRSVEGRKSPTQPGVVPGHRWPGRPSVIPTESHIGGRTPSGPARPGGTSNRRVVRDLRSGTPKLPAMADTVRKDRWKSRESIIL